MLPLLHDDSGKLVDVDVLLVGLFVAVAVVVAVVVELKLKHEAAADVAGAVGELKLKLNHRFG